jgi:hypothetical protein
LGIAVALAGLGSAWVAKLLLRYISQNAFRQIGYGAMVLSGLSMCVSGGGALANNQGVKGQYSFVSGEVTTKLIWPKGQLALEMTWDDGPEVEVPVPLQDVPMGIRSKMVARLKPGQRYSIEEVFALNHHAYELYQQEDKSVAVTEFEVEE